MDIQQLKTFVTVARAGTITRASELLHLSQPAVSAQVKALEDALGISLFERTARGMSLSADGAQLLAKAERALAVHQEVFEEALRLKGRLQGALRLGAGSNSNHEAIGRLLAGFAENFPEVTLTLRHGTSAEVLAGLRDGSLDAGFYNEAGEPPEDLVTTLVSRFSVYLTGAPGLLAENSPLDPQLLRSIPWVYPTSSACCSRAAESLFALYGFRPERVLSVDREDVTRSLVRGGLGVGLLHAPSALEGKSRGELELLVEAPTRVSILFAHRVERGQNPLLAAARSMLTGLAGAG